MGGYGMVVSKIIQDTDHILCSMLTLLPPVVLLITFLLISYLIND